MKYLALGDSYTIGEAVEQSGSFPYQLASQIQAKTGNVFTEIKTIAKTGWTTDELQEAILQQSPASDYDLVTLLIGVNNQYRSYSMFQYSKELDALLRQAISFAKGKASHVLLIGIPDYGCTPFGAGQAQHIDAELKRYNFMCKETADRYSVTFVPIFEISKLASSQPALIASDQLHPSAMMYELWVNEIIPHAMRMVNEPY